MIKAFLFDFSRTLLFPKDKNYTGGLNSLHKGLSENANYRFLDNFELNKELMDYLFSIKEKMSIYMFTSETIQETPEIKSGVSKVFSRIFSAKEMGMDKKDPETYKFISNELKLEPNEIVFVDDNSKNIEAAKKAGINVFQYKNNSVIDNLEEIRGF
ncbi:MAG: seg [Microgenomates group bacterium GW2011_GWC1_39_7b]|uniref:HAD-superfamily hydrolase, subfamily IA, variant 3 n=3 Tax=Candidatus Woeseibacteriota TaxID=1752722 RepID=A0A0G0TGN5_9BACT|nr:MAG: seg [Microgenomates group bacterium GW2011_GWC1_39_7b]KKR74026.1 MAG: HAD-superfamily hydrolase, subfamily IA, variant 3 [Candidatus Woesebacteria bacterium GW2011_GWA2_40_7]